MTSTKDRKTGFIVSVFAPNNLITRINTADYNLQNIFTLNENEERPKAQSKFIGQVLLYNTLKDEPETEYTKIRDNAVILLQELSQNKISDEVNKIISETIERDNFFLNSLVANLKERLDFLESIGKIGDSDEFKNQIEKLEIIILDFTLEVQSKIKYINDISKWHQVYNDYIGNIYQQINKVIKSLV